MNPFDQIKRAFTQTLITLFNLDADTASVLGVLFIHDGELKVDQGDCSSTVALQLARRLSRPPRDIAHTIMSNFHHAYVSRIEFAGAGFLNFYLTHEAFASLAAFLCSAKESAFKPSTLRHRKYSLEFVSANPTGPLHFGHGRGGVIGDVLGNILSFVGHTVTKEFYVNDVGSQMNKLGLSLKARYLPLCGDDAALMPEDGYQGDYIKDLARDLFNEKGASGHHAGVEFFTSYAYKKLLDRIQGTLSRYGIHYQVWFSEKVLHDTGAISEALSILRARGYLVEKEGALWFRATEFGDDKDRVVVRSSGELTYVAADIAYLLNKVERGNNELIMILGQDHHGYAARLQAALRALQLDSQANLSTILYQLVRMVKEDVLVKMSKRAGSLVTLDDVMDTVGTDIARFFYLYRKADAHLDFDLQLATTHTDENPVYYIQYALVRTNSILHKALQAKEFAQIGLSDAVYIEESEHLILKKIASLAALLMTISISHQTHLIAYYTHELAQIFNRYYSRYTVINANNISQSRGRLLVVLLVQRTLKLLLSLMGIEAPEHM